MKALMLEFECNGKEGERLKTVKVILVGIDEEGKETRTEYEKFALVTFEEAARVTVNGLSMTELAFATAVLQGKFTKDLNS